MNEYRRLFWRAVLPISAFLAGVLFTRCTEDRKP